MAIFSLNHSSIGRSTHAPGTAGAHVDYITRPGARAEVLAERMPDQAEQARAWLDQAEAAERKNGRVIDKVMVALPRELNNQQQVELVREFANQVTLGRASWLAAIHRDKSGNPHAHIIIRDKDPKTGKRVASLSEKGSTERLREAWEQVANAALLGKGERIDRRSLKAQGIERTAQIHVGPKIKAMEAKEKRPESKVRTDHKGRVIRYPEIDKGTRNERNRQILNDNRRSMWRPSRLTSFDERFFGSKEAAAQHEAAKLEAQREAEAKVRAEIVAARAKAEQEAREVQAQEAASRAEAFQAIFAAHRYDTLLESFRDAKKAASGVDWERKQWIQNHPWRARLHSLGWKAQALSKLDDLLKAAEKAQKALESDPEGKRAYEAREAAKREAVRQEQERQYQRNQERQSREAKERQRARSIERDDFGFGR